MAENVNPAVIQDQEEVKVQSGRARGGLELAQAGVRKGLRAGRVDLRGQQDHSLDSGFPGHVQ